MKAYYQCKDINNFGDIVGAWVLEHRHKEPVEWDNSKEEPIIFAGGSQLTLAHDNAIIQCCGFSSPDETCEKPLRIDSVRGKLTRDRLIELGIECPEVYHDYAYELKEFFDFEKMRSHEYKCGVIPHYVDYNIQKVNTGDLKIDICSGVINVLIEVLSCDHIYSSSLHGLILAHACGIQFTWIPTIKKIVSPKFKFYDWASGFSLSL